MDAPAVNCDEDGNFAKKQCDGFRQMCYCVTVEDGKTIPGSLISRREGEPDCDADQFKPYYEKKCLAERQKSEGLVGGFVPSCDEFGFYEKKQCRGNLPPQYAECWCLTRDGREIPTSRRNIRDELDCESEEFKEFYEMQPGTMF